MSKQHPLIQPLMRDLRDAGRLRVWSLIVTILGDVAHPRGDVMSMADLLTLTDHMEIESGAVRTALSRLSKEEWVISTKSGRTSSYAFSAGGRTTFESVAARVYNGRYAPEPTQWVVAILPPARAKDRQAMQHVLDDASALQTQSGVAMWPCSTAPKPGFLEQLGCLCFTGQLDHIPTWVKNDCAPPEAEALALHFLDKYKDLANFKGTLPAIDALIARVLIVHDWRRMLLRYPIVPMALQPDQWSMPKAHARMMTIYRGLIKPSEAHWSSPVSKKGQLILDKRFNPES